MCAVVPPIGLYIAYNICTSMIGSLLVGRNNSANSRLKLCVCVCVCVVPYSQVQL